MSIKISFKKSTSRKNSTNLVLFVDEKFSLSQIKKYISAQELFYISDLLKTKDVKRKILFFDINSKRKIILVSLSKDLTISEVENLGADCYKIIKESKKLNFL